MSMTDGVEIFCCMFLPYKPDGMLIFNLAFDGEDLMHDRLVKKI